MSRTAVVLFNLGGPDSRAAVKPFLFNLFSDPAIIALPNPLRWVIAKLIAGRRTRTAEAIYAKLGDASPLLANTEAQGRALEAALGPNHRTFIAMRYWHPRADATAAAVKAWNADRVMLLPLYPQYSTTTTASSLADWRRAAEKVGLRLPTAALCCYPTARGFIAALARAIDQALAAWPRDLALRILLSAHGLPEKIVAKGDPYPEQVAQTAAALRTAVARPDLEMVQCYQSRVGPLAWIGPATDAEIRRAGAEGVGLIVVPIAFVSEHSETLVELDMEYGHLARQCGVPRYVRVPTAGTAPEFIASLAALVGERAHADDAAPVPEGGSRRCAPGRAGCPCPRDKA